MSVDICAWRSDWWPLSSATKIEFRRVRTLFWCLHVVPIYVVGNYHYLTIHLPSLSAFSTACRFSAAALYSVRRRFFLRWKLMTKLALLCPIPPPLLVLFHLVPLFLELNFSSSSSSLLVIQFFIHLCVYLAGFTGNFSFFFQWVDMSHIFSLEEEKRRNFYQFEWYPSTYKRMMCNACWHHILYIPYSSIPLNH